MKGFDTMFEITYRFKREACFYGHYTGIFFSTEEWEAFANDCKADNDPVEVLYTSQIDPMEWYKTKSSSYERSYVVEVMAIAIMGQEWAFQYDKWRDLEKALKELGII